jgi:hypothetical protein
MIFRIKKPSQSIDGFKIISKIAIITLKTDIYNSLGLQKFL